MVENQGYGGNSPAEELRLNPISLPPGLQSIANFLTNSTCGAQASIRDKSDSRVSLGLHGVQALQKVAMILIQQVGLEVIEAHLPKLGGKNHDDNINRLRRFDHHCSVSLNQDEFLGLVFLQNDEVVRISPRGGDRKIRAVANRAIGLGQPTLSDHWNLAKNLELMRDAPQWEHFSGAIDDLRIQRWRGSAWAMVSARRFASGARLCNAGSAK